MGVERVDYYTEDEYQQALEEENVSMNSHQEPDVVPCFKCGCQMYQECHAAEGNICPSCRPEKESNQ
jgi:hypothetical protein